MAQNEYDLMVIGAGSGGLTAVEFAHKLGVRVALVEKHRLGGDCTWTGCVPSKALLHVAKVAHTARTAQAVGVSVGKPVVDMVQVRVTVQKAIADVYQHETPETLTAQGVDVFLGEAHFLDSHHVQVGESVLTAKKFVITTGAHPFIPPVPGLRDVPFLTYEQIFDNDRLPTHLLILGAGAVGVEIAQAYARLGAAVTLVDIAFLPAEEGDVGQLLQTILAGEGVNFVAGLATAVSHTHNSFQLSVENQTTGKTETIQGDMLLVATGRRPNVAGLDLEMAGVAYSSKGIQVDDTLTTNVAHIFAAGDCIGGAQFTHLAGWQAFTAVRNALLPGKSKGMPKVLPYTIFTEPEVAQVGLTAVAAQQQFGEGVTVLKQDLDRLDRAVVDQAQRGFIKIVVDENGRILGATIVAPRAGEMISEISLTMQHNIKLRGLADAMRPYPTYSMGTQLLAASQATDDFLNSIIGRLSLRFLR
ncbi:Mercuric ion reductase [hydrothermal vent metagenome]|uniref:Mercuric ion reductase n=1 Tax=hydrothermal vent metagenome TaxID=652676 RepID=A0A3B0VFC1_9ZZZZ